MSRASVPTAGHVPVRRPLSAVLWKQRYLFLLLAPGLAYFVVYRYLPIWGILMAFQDFIPNLGFFGSPWVGLKHFDRFFGEPEFCLLFLNTLVIALYSVAVLLPHPHRHGPAAERSPQRTGFKRLVQTDDLPAALPVLGRHGRPHPQPAVDEDGLVNARPGADRRQEDRLSAGAAWFRPVIVMQAIWKDAGWGTHHVSGRPGRRRRQLYEAAIIEGANRWQQLRLDHAAVDPEHHHDHPDPAPRQVSRRAASSRSCSCQRR